MLLGKKEKSSSCRLSHVEKEVEEKIKNEENEFDQNIITSI